MSFLDNLENNLKALESREEHDPTRAGREAAARERDRLEAQGRAPHAEALKTGEFTNQLLTHCRAIGHSTNSPLLSRFVPIALPGMRKVFRRFASIAV